MFKGVFYRENLQVDTQQLSSSAEILHFHASLGQMLAVSFVDKDFWHTLGTKNGFVVLQFILLLFIPLPLACKVIYSLFKISETDGRRTADVRLL